MIARIEPNDHRRPPTNRGWARYCHALDFGDWQTITECFTEDAIFIESEAGELPIADFLGSLPVVAKSIKSMMHLVSTTLIEVDGDSATSKAACVCPMVLVSPEGEDHYVLQHLWYHDELRRTPQGWRITRREQVGYASDGMPDWAFASAE